MSESLLNKKQAWGISIAGILYFTVLRGARALRYGIEYIRPAYLTDSTATISIGLYMYNPLLVGVFLRRLDANVRIQGIQVGTVSEELNYNIEPHKMARVSFNLNVDAVKLGKSLFQWIMSGNVNNLAIEVDGKLTVGRDRTVKVPIHKLMTWREIDPWRVEE